MGRKYYLDPNTGEKIYIRDKVPSLKNYRKAAEQDTIDNSLSQRIDAIESAKFPNVVFVGEPLIVGSNVSRFSADDYMIFPFEVDVKNKPFVIDFCFTTGSDVSAQQNILDSEFGVALAIQNGKGVMAMSSNGTSWNIGLATGTHTIEPNKVYYAKIAWDGSVYTGALSEDGSTYVTDMQFASTAGLYPKTIYIGASPNLFGPNTAHPFKGVIDMSSAKLTIAGLEVWHGMDDPGLASRANVSLSNLDELGEARFKAENLPYGESNVGAEISNLKEDLSQLDGRVTALEDEPKVPESLVEQVDDNTRSLDALWKLSKGQLWDIEQVECEGHAQLPSGGEYGNVDEVRGKTEQESTNGYQLLDGLNDSISASGLTFTNNGDGSFSLTGTSTNTQSFVIKKVSVKGGTYTLSSNIAGANNIYLRVRDENNISNAKVITSGTSGSITVENDTDLLVQIFVIGSDITVNSTWYPMLEHGSVAHLYEPYTGGIPSPNPDYPQEIKSVEEIHVTHTGKNLFSPKTGYYSNGRYSLEEDEFVCEAFGVDFYIGDFANVGLTVSPTRCILIPCNKRKLYVSLFGDFDKVVANYVDKNYISLSSHLNLTSINAATLPADAEYLSIRPGVAGSASGRTYRGRVMVSNQPVTDFEPYRSEVRTIIPPRPLNAIGEYQDKCDVVNGVWTYTIKDTDIASMGIVSWSNYWNGLCTVSRTRLPSDFDGLKLLSNRFVYTSTYLVTKNAVYADNNNLIFNVSTFADEVIGMRNWFTENNPKLLYSMKQAETEPVDPADLEWLRNLTLLPGENLFITDNHGRDVSYLMSDFINLGKVGG